jgi:hypothetical protein
VNGDLAAFSAKTWNVARGTVQGRCDGQSENRALWGAPRTLASLALRPMSAVLTINPEIELISPSSQSHALCYRRAVQSM